MPKSKQPKLPSIVPSNAPGAGHDDIKLTQQESQLVRDVRLLSAEQQALYFDVIHDCAKEARSKKPALRLVAGGAA